MTDLLNFEIRTGTDGDVPDTDPHAPEDTDARVEPAIDPAPAPLVVLEGEQMSERDQLFTTLAHVLRVARRKYKDAAERDGSVVHSLVRGQPPSVHDQHQYARGKAWVPPSHDGGTLEGMGDIYHWLLGLPGVTVTDALGALISRPLRFSAAVVITTPVVIFALLATGHKTWAVTYGAIVAVTGALWVAAGYALAHVRRVISQASVPAGPGTNETDEF